MRVRCKHVDTSCYEDKSITVGKEYEVLHENGTLYCIVDDRGKQEYHFKFRFEIMKEEKVEEVKVVRKLEDLEGMENGFGLTIDENLDVVRKGFHGYYLRREELLTFEGYLGAIKCMGFRFEYKPLRTEQEVKKEIMSLESLPFTQEKVNYFVDYNSLINKYLVICDSVNGHGLHIYMSEELAQKYADELNEILKGGK